MKDASFHNSLRSNDPYTGKSERSSVNGCYIKIALKKTVDQHQAETQEQYNANYDEINFFHCLLLFKLNPIVAPTAGAKKLRGLPMMDIIAIEPRMPPNNVNKYEPRRFPIFPIKYTT